MLCLKFLEGRFNINGKNKDHHLLIAFNEPAGDYLLSEDFSKGLSECGSPFLLFGEHSGFSHYLSRKLHFQLLVYLQTWINLNISMYLNRIYFGFDCKNELFFFFCILA